MIEQNCEIVRDLIPLAADDVASESSKRLIESHIQDCPACRACYDMMTAKIAEPAPIAEDSRFIRLCRRMEKNFRWRKFILWLLVIALSVSIITFAVWDIFESRGHRWGAMPHEWASAELYIDDSGNLILHCRMLNGHTYHVPTEWYSRVDEQYEGDGIYYIDPLKPSLEFGRYDVNDTEFTHTTEIDLIDGKLQYPNPIWHEYQDEDTGTQVFETTSEEYVPIREIRFGSHDLEHSKLTPDEYAVLWTESDPLPKKHPK